jgi:hypothetical protein
MFNFGINLGMFSNITQSSSNPAIDGIAPAATSCTTAFSNYEFIL